MGKYDDSPGEMGNHSTIHRIGGILVLQGGTPLHHPSHGLPFYYQNLWWLGDPPHQKKHTYPYHPIHSQKVSHSDLTSVTPFHQLITSQLVQPQQKSTRICPKKMIHSSFSSQCHDTHVLITSSINSCCSSRKTSHYSGCFNPNTLG